MLPSAHFNSAHNKTHLLLLLWLSLLKPGHKGEGEGWVASSRHGWLAICISTLIFSISIPPFALKHILDFLSLISSVVERIYPEYISRFCLEIDDHVTIFAIHWIMITRISTTFYNCPPICHIGFSPLIITNERVLHNWKFKRTPLEFPKLANAQLLTLDT